jgi:modulator of FtsH protease HflK
VVPKAEGRAARLKEEAEGYKARVVAQADGDSQRFKSVLTEYQKAPGVTRDRMYLDAMQQIYSSTTKILVDSRSGNNLLSLPLDRLLQQGQATVTVPAAPAPVEAAPAAPANDARSRSRDSR